MTNKPKQEQDLLDQLQHASQGYDQLDSARIGLGDALSGTERDAFVVAWWIVKGLIEEVHVWGLIWREEVAEGDQDALEERYAQDLAPVFGRGARALKSLGGDASANDMVAALAGLVRETEKALHGMVDELPGPQEDPSP